VKCVSNVPMFFEALWDMSETDMSHVYGTCTVSDLQQAVVVVGGHTTNNTRNRAVCISVRAVNSVMQTVYRYQLCR
jgi:hypothetical protein